MASPYGQPAPYGMVPVAYGGYPPQQQPQHQASHSHSQQQRRLPPSSSQQSNPGASQTLDKEGRTSLPLMPEFPPGMEYLKHVDRLFIHQEFELLECLFCLETNNKYLVKNANSQIAYRAEEDTQFWQRCLCCSSRGYQLAVYDGSERQVMTLRRSITCCAFNCCWEKRRSVVELFDVESRPIGSIRQDLSCLVPTYLLVEKLQSGEEIVLILKAPRCLTFSCCSTSEFRIYQERDDGERHKVGDITKKYGGCFRETCTDADEWAINFPLAMPITHKALVMAACFAIDFRYFEG